MHFSRRIWGKNKVFGRTRTEMLTHATGWRVDGWDCRAVDCNTVKSNDSTDIGQPGIAMFYVQTNKSFAV